MRPRSALGELEELECYKRVIVFSNLSGSWKISYVKVSIWRNLMVL